MAKKVSNFSDLIQRVTASCLLHPLGSNRFPDVQTTPDHHHHHHHHFPYTNNLKSKLTNPDDFDDDPNHYTPSSSSSKEEEEEETSEIYEDARENEENGSLIKYKPNNKTMGINSNNNNNGGDLRENEMGIILEQVFDAISRMKKAYGKLQEAHNPWDVEKMRVADEAVVVELRRVAVLRERFRRGGRGRKAVVVTAETVEEVVAPYEAVVEELKKEVRVREVELEELKCKVSVLSCSGGGNGKKNGKSLSRKKSYSFVQSQVWGPHCICKRVTLKFTIMHLVTPLLNIMEVGPMEDWS